MAFKFFIAYFTIMFLATITPGPSMLLALNHGANYGIKKTIFSGLGNSLANLLMAIVSFAGLGVVLMTSGILFNIIKWLGVLYLIYLGLNLLFQSSASELKNIANNKTKEMGRKKGRYLFWEGFLIAVGNPKGILFFTALFPQFVQSDINTSGIILIFLSLVLVAFFCYMLYAFAGKKLNILFNKLTFKKVFNKVTGAIFIGTGLALAFSKR